MAEDELSPLDKLMLAVSASESPKTVEKSDLNDDELFLAKIAANDLKTPYTSTSTLKKQLSLTSKNTPINQPSTTSSLVQSDDESELNSYGQEIEHLLAETSTSTPTTLRNEFEPQTKTWKPKRQIQAIPPGKFGLSPVPQPPIKKTTDDILQDPFFGIRITKPLISSALLEERMKGRAAVSMFRVKNFIAQNGHTQDWVIAGCIVQKTNARTSQNGNQYIIWTLSDLQNDLQTVSMFLFKSAYKELWKTSVGTVVGVLNPSILDNREGSKHQATLSVDNHQRVMLFGHSKDYGLCKSRKKDGEPCTAFVNLNRCSYCLYHVKQEYQKCSLRSDCQSIGGGLTALRNKVLGKNEVFYAGKSYMAIPARQNKKLAEKDTKRLSDLMNTNLMTSSPLPSQKQNRKKAIASSLEVSRAQRFKDLQLLQKLNGSSDILSGLETRKECDLNETSAEVTLEESRQTALDTIAKLKQKAKTVVQNENTPEEIPIKDCIDTSKLKLLKDLHTGPAPTLSRNAVIDLSSPIPDRAKLKALQWVKKNGPINREQQPKKTGVKRFLETVDDTEENTKKKSKLEEKAQFSERFRKIMEMTSAHADLLEDRDRDEQEKYFNKLENREKMEEKMMSTYKIKCKAVKCLNCKYTSFSASAKCKQEKHSLKVFDAMKRFFKCGNCGNRTCTLDVFPIKSCTNCNSTKWERAAMMKEKTVQIGNALSIRGGEQKFINSGVTDANINLLIPDE